MMTTSDVNSRGNVSSYLASSLKAAQLQKVEFDPENAEHRKAYADFVRTGKWTIMFATVWPKTIYQTVLSSLAQHACKSEWNN